MFSLQLWHVLSLGIRVAEDLFILSFLSWMLFADVSRRNPIRRHLVDKLRRPFVWLGLNANWRMFSPNPPLRTIWPQVRLTLDDASEIFWEPEPLATMSVRKKIAQKKFHKYYHEAVRPPAPPQSRRDFMEYLLRSMPEGTVCTKVDLYRIAIPTPPPGQSQSPHPASRTLVFTFHPYVDDNDD